MDSQHEQELVKKSQTDITAFKELYTYYYPKIYAYVLYLVRDREVCEDIVSTTFEKSMLNILNFQYKGYSFGSWLYTIARNMVYDQSKKQTNISLEILKDVIVCKGEFNTEEMVDTELRKRKLLEAINALPERSREIVLLRYIEGFSIQEVSVITGDTTDAIKSVCKRSLDDIKQYLEGSI